jgi:hypothetical protein
MLDGPGAGVRAGTVMLAESQFLVLGSGAPSRGLLSLDGFGAGRSTKGPARWAGRKAAGLPCGRWLSGRRGTAPTWWTGLA